MPPSHLLAIDQGTTGSTALVLDGDARIVGRGYAEFPQHYPQPGWVEHDPDDLYDVSMEVATSALADAGLRAGDVAGLGITNQRETTVVWDRATGRPLAPAIVWQDRRTAAMCAELRAQGLEGLVRERTGLVIDAYFSGTKLAWLLENVDGLRRRAEAGEVAFGTVDAWLLYRLTGGSVHATDVTNASRTMLFDLRRLEWDDELLAHLRIPRQVLPEVHPSAAVHGTTVPAALGGEIPVAALLGDQQAALFAQACFAPGQTKNTYGTGSFVLMHAGGQPFVEQERMLSTVAATLEGAPAEYALEGSIFVTGSAVQWMRDELGIITSAAETEAIARSVPDTGDVWFVPALAGLGAPYWDPYARGMLIGITRGTSKAHIVRAVLESIAFSTRDVLDAMQADTGIRIDELRADGGAVANRFLMQHQADVLGIPVDVPAQTESTSLGSGLLAGLTTGVWGSLEELAGVRTTAARYEPAMSADERDGRYARWSQAVARARDWATGS
ncbi:glycerol kinase GlpK [Acidiferrimicrobium sp. IK]|uniref:glycerol kinase GlpK n=1 Tax=Acidiferrimicrobium sp. IK TaxID=2871700 RepID=UPI0021CB90F9|nr:glycerol kinase GlpK [Acidiferrimicrobium sp. IK]MCU4184327.1 glycerol kinase GlpK [Acidiferrimicrobium sp. IK]